MKTVAQFSHWLGGLTALLLTLSGGSAFGMNATVGGALPAPLPLFPADNWWNVDISAWPLDPNSASYISFINNGGTRHLHPDFGGDAPTPQDPYACYGMPYVVVSGVSSADLVPAEFSYARVTFCSSATATKYRRWRSSIRRPAYRLSVVSQATRYFHSDCL